MTEFSWLQPLPDAAEMRATDAAAISRGTASTMLMENAGRSVADAILRSHPDGKVIVVCGKGNNGGDGLVAARFLREAGREVTVLTLWERHQLSAEAEAQLDRLPTSSTTTFSPSLLVDAAVIVDALLGTGFTGTPRPPVDRAIAAINSVACAVVAIDVPSGVDASSGEVEQAAVRATRTVTFHAAKSGLWITPGKQHAGIVEVADIGIPPAVLSETKAGLITPDVLTTLPRRSQNSTKFSSGNVIVVGGSPGLTGAPIMAAAAALRAGAGYVTLAIPESVEAIVAAAQAETMTVALPQESGALSVKGIDDLLAYVQRADAVLVGSGMGKQRSVKDLLFQLLPRLDIPFVLDADGLSAFAGQIELIAERTVPAVLTPHAGELGRLLGKKSAEIAAHRRYYAQAAAAAADAVVVLKGDDTIVADACGRIAISPGNAPALATAGTGDALAGVIAALLAGHLDPFTAACAGVFLHLRAGQLAAVPNGPDAVIASDVIAALPSARRRSARTG